MQFVSFGATETANVFAGPTEAELDGVSFGVIQVDAAGTILLCNAAEAAIGRNFFTEVALCPDVPGFRGRFDAGEASGESNVVFEFARGGAGAPMMRGHMAKAARGGNDWIGTKRL